MYRFSPPNTNHFGPFPSFSIRINIIKKCLKKTAVTSRGRHFILSYTRHRLTFE